MAERLHLFLPRRKGDRLEITEGPSRLLADLGQRDRRLLGLGLPGLGSEVGIDIVPVVLADGQNELDVAFG